MTTAVNDPIHVNVQTIDFWWQSAFRERIWLSNVGGGQAPEVIHARLIICWTTVALVDLGITLGDLAKDGGNMAHKHGRRYSYAEQCEVHVNRGPCQYYTVVYIISTERVLVPFRRKYFS